MRVAVAGFPFPTLDVTAPVVFILGPALVPLTLTEKTQEAPAASVAPESATELLPAVAVMVPPPQDPVRPFGVETTRPAGKVSLNPIPVSVTGLPAGLLIVKVRVLAPFRGIEDGVKVLEMVGVLGVTTVRVVVAPFPDPTLVERAPASITLVNVPAVGPVTVTVTLQELFAGTVAPVVRVTTFPATVTVPAGHVVAALAPTTPSPVGKASINGANKVAGTAFGLVIVMLATEVPFTGIEDGEKVLEMVGGTSTTLVAPVPLIVPSLAVIVCEPGVTSLAWNDLTP
jgi:hypothetical protein